MAAAAPAAGQAVSPSVHALELRDVWAGYGRIEVLRGVSLSVPTGTVFALVGSNCAGKTTLLKVAGGRLGPRSGCVHIAGRHVNGISPAALARAGVCSVSEGHSVFANLTVFENLRMASYCGRPRGDIEERACARFPVLGKRRNQLAGSLSGGEQQMLAMARALTTDPSLLLLDEISMGLAPKIVGELFDQVTAVAAEGVTVVLAEQFAGVALAVADYAAVMNKGRLERVGEPCDVVEVIPQAYLGRRR